MRKQIQRGKSPCPRLKSSQSMIPTWNSNSKAHPRITAVMFLSSASQTDPSFVKVFVRVQHTYSSTSFFFIYFLGEILF